MTSPSPAFCGASCPFLQQSPIMIVRFCSRSRCLLIPRRLERRREEGSAAGPGRSNPARKSKKEAQPALRLFHRSSQLQLKACRFVPRRQITGCTANAASC
jgi:hypothetical protein